VFFWKSIGCFFWKSIGGRLVVRQTLQSSPCLDGMFGKMRKNWVLTSVILLMLFCDKNFCVSENLGNLSLVNPGIAPVRGSNQEKTPQYQGFFHFACGEPSKTSLKENDCLVENWGPEESNGHSSQCILNSPPLKVDERLPTLPDRLPADDDGSQGLHQCPVCTREFVYKGYLKMHVRIHAAEKRARRRKFRQKLFTSQATLHAHVKTRRREKRFRCTICAKRYSYEANLNTHLKNHTREQAYSCPHCPRTFATCKYLKVHVKAHAAGRAVEKRKRLGKQAVCNFSSSENARRPARQVFECNDCSMSFSRNASWQAHKRAHAGRVSVRRLKTTKSRPEVVKDLSVRFKAIRSNPASSRNESRRYPCPLCSERFENKTALRMHLRVHTGERPHKCTCCEKSFKLLQTLRVHMRIHTGEKPYKCPHCSACFRQTSNLKVHLLKHSGDLTQATAALGSKAGLWRTTLWIYAVMLRTWAHSSFQQWSRLSRRSERKEKYRKQDHKKKRLVDWVLPFHRLRFLLQIHWTVTSKITLADRISFMFEISHTVH